MGYNDIYSTMVKTGLSSEPAFMDTSFVLAPIPCYDGRCPLGLYDPDTRTVILPPEFSEAALLHELGHRYDHYYSRSGNLSEDFAESFRKKYSNGNAMVAYLPCHTAQFGGCSCHNRPVAYQPNQVEGNWVEVARGNVSPDGIQGSIWKSINEIQPGTEGLMHLKAPGIGPVMDAAGVEKVVSSIFYTQGARITVVDCYGEGWNDGYIRFRGSPVAVLAIFAAMVPILQTLLYIGIVVAISILVWKAAEIVKPVVSNPLSLALAGGAVLGGIYLMGRR